MPNTLLLTLAISLIIQAFFFTFAASLKTDKVTDLSYGLSFIALAFYTLLTSSVFSPLQILVVSLILLWGIRIATYLFVRILKIGRDKRFDGIRENFLKFAQFWTLQGFAVWIIMLPGLILLSSPIDLPITPLSIIGATIAITGLAIETVADWQKFTFKNKPQNKGKFIQSGIWKYSRYPNYFGEMTFWWGIFMVTLPALSGASYLAIIGPGFITYLLIFGTGIPPLEKKQLQKYGKLESFKKYRKNTSLLIPLPPQK